MRIQGGKRQSSEVKSGAVYLRRRQVAERCQVSLRTLERLASRGEGPPVISIGRVKLYAVAEVDAWLRSQAGGGL